MALNEEQITWLNSLDKNCKHGSNILAKKKEDSIEIYYNEYKNFYELVSGSNIDDKINAFIEYKQFAYNNNKITNYSPQSKFEPTILEEFVYHLFNKFYSEEIKGGSVKAYSNLYFSPANIDEFKISNSILVNEKDQDFAIYKKVTLRYIHNNNSERSLDLSVPIICIECKTYLDKTMLEGSIATAEKIKAGNPHCKFYILTETYEVNLNVDPATSRIDNIFVLKKGIKKPDRQNNIDGDVIIIFRSC